jgi:hypothetical protein
MKRIAQIAVLWGAFFVLLHQPSGRNIYVNAEQVDYIAPGNMAAGDPPNTGSRLMVYGVWVAVKETPDEIKTQIDKVLGQDKPVAEK